MRGIFRLSLCLAAIATLTGCLIAPRTELNAANAQNRALSDQNRAELAEIENLRNHSRRWKTA